MIQHSDTTTDKALMETAIERGVVASERLGVGMLLWPGAPGGDPRT